MRFSALPSLLLLSASLIFPTLSTPAFKKHPLPLPVKVLHQFPPGTWLENLAIRANGKVLTTALSSPELFQVDNHGKDPLKLVHTFANATACTGIVKSGIDTFYVIAGNFSLNNFTAVPGSWSVYKVNLRPYFPHLTKSKPARVSLVATFPESIMLNGITVLNGRKKWFLISDSGAGLVYRLDAKSGDFFKVLEDPLMKPDSQSMGIGVNGINHPGGKIVYFTNTDRNIIALQTIHKDGTAKKPATVVAHIDSPDDIGYHKDDDQGMVVQNGADRLTRITPFWQPQLGDIDLMGRVFLYGVKTLVDGVSNGPESELHGPTAVEPGKDIEAGKSKVYISTNGGLEQYRTGNITRGGTISVVDTYGYW